MCLVRLSRSRLFPFVDVFVFSFSVGIFVSGVEFMLHQVKAHWDHRMDFWWRLQSIASTPTASIAPLKSCRVFESVYRGRRMCLPGGVQGNDKIPSAYVYLQVSGLVTGVELF